MATALKLNLKLHSNSICFLLLPILFVLQAKLIFACKSEIYCRGELLDTVQMAKIFNDSKTFVDMKMKYDENKTMEKFYEMMNEIEPNQPNQTTIKQFVNNYFEPVGKEFIPWIPDDWRPDPEFLNKIYDDSLRQFAEELHILWKQLGRKMDPKIKDEEEKYSIIYVENPVVVPGGRFREFYYWDSYWIVRGLLLSEMHHTVKGMLENFLGLVDKFGFVPNGGRIYYERSQPPLLTPMVKSYFDKTNDLEFLKNHTHTLEKELNFWLSKRTITVPAHNRNYTVAVYSQTSPGPRPESYREDVMSAQFFNEADREKHYKQLKSAAESGWDFSSRWFVAKDNTHNGNLTDLKTSTIVPVDLNSIIQWNARLISEFYCILGNKSKHEYYKKVAEEFKEVLDTLLWNDEYGVWMDYDSENRISRPYFYPSNLAPLWTQSYKDVECGSGKSLGVDKNVQDRIERVLRYLNSPDVAIKSYPGGVPTTLLNTGEQWDFPNAWAPLQHMVILGLDSTDNQEAKDLSFDLCQKWVRSNHKAYLETNHMYEKYNATHAGAPGNGGEYEVQLGFGWTNGVILDLLNKYGDRLSSTSNSLTSDGSS